MSGLPAPDAAVAVARIYHVTTPGDAQAVVSQRVYTPFSTAPFDADGGLNCFSKAKTYNLGQKLHGYGAEIHFEWRGQTVVQQVESLSMPFPPGILLDQAPWRLHLRGPIGPQQLRVTHLTFKNAALIHFLGQALWERWVPKRWRPHRRRRLDFLQELRTLYRRQQCFVSIDY